MSNFETEGGSLDPTVVSRIRHNIREQRTKNSRKERSDWMLFLVLCDPNENSSAIFIRTIKLHNPVGKNKKK